MPGNDLGDQMGSGLGDDMGSTPPSGGQPTSIVSPTDVTFLVGNWLKAGDTGPLLTCILVDQNGPVDLTAVASIAFKARGLYYGALITGAATILPVVPAIGTPQVQYAWQAGDTAVADTYHAQFTVTFNSGMVISFPDDNDIRLYIAPGVV